MFTNERITASAADTIRVRQLPGRVVLDTLADRNAFVLRAPHATKWWSDYETALREISAATGLWVELVNG